MIKLNCLLAEYKTLLLSLLFKKEQGQFNQNECWLHFCKVESLKNAIWLKDQFI